MSSLDKFRRSWQYELESNRQTVNGHVSDSPLLGDLCRLGTRNKRSMETDFDLTVPAIAYQPEPSHEFSSTKLSFTIGIRQFSSASKNAAQMPMVKKCKLSQEETLVDQLIRDIDELTDVPFFNMSLPREIALKIFGHLSIQDLYSCLRVCRAWYTLSCDELLWFHLYRGFQSKSNVDDESLSWKERVRDAVLFDEKMRTNFRNHQCRTTKLTYRLGHILTCARNDSTTIVAGYSTGMIRTWPIQSIIDIDDNDENGEYVSDTPDVIYETNSDSSPVRSVGLLKNDVYAVHNDGLLEVWHKDLNDKPYFSFPLNSNHIEQVNSIDSYLGISTGLNFHVCHWNDSIPNHGVWHYFSEFNDTISSFAMSNEHGVPITIVAGKKNIWCVSLSELQHRHGFYSLLESDNVPKISVDIHSIQPMAIVAFGCQIKLFDLYSGRCNILSNDYHSLPAEVRLIQAHHCPANEFLVAFDNYQISIFDQRQKQGSIQNFYGHCGSITTLQMDSWKVASTDDYGYVHLWDRRMQSQSLWNIHPQAHPVTYSSFDEQTLIFALTPFRQDVDMIEYQLNPDAYCGHIYLCNFNANVSTKLEDDMKICTSTYDAPTASHRRIDLYTPYDSIG